MGRRSALLAAGLLAGGLVLLSILVTLGLPRLIRGSLTRWASSAPGLTMTLGRVSFDPWHRSVDLRDLTVCDHGHILLELRAAHARVHARALMARSLVLDGLSLEGVHVVLHRDARGRFNIEQLLPSRRTGAEDTGGLRWEIQHLVVSDLRLELTDPDLGLAHTLRLSVGHFELERIGTLQVQDGHFAIGLHGGDPGAPAWALDIQGTMDFAPFESTGKFKLTGLSLPWLKDAVQASWPVQITRGRMDATGGFELSESRGHGRFRLRDTTVALDGLELSGAGSAPDRLNMQRLEVRIARMDSASDVLLGSTVRIDAPVLLLHRRGDGWLSPLRSAAMQTHRQQGSRQAAPWRIQWPLVEVRSGQLQLVGGGVAGQPTWHLSGLDARLEGLQTDGDAAARIFVQCDALNAAAPAAAGRWSINATLRPKSGAVGALWRVQQQPLAPILTLLGRAGVLWGVSGELSAHGEVHGNMYAWHAMQGSGAVQLTNLRLSDPAPPAGRTPSQLQVSAFDRRVLLDGLRWEGGARRVAVSHLRAGPGRLTISRAARAVNLRWARVEGTSLQTGSRMQHLAIGQIEGTGFVLGGVRRWLRLTSMQLGSLQVDPDRRSLALKSVAVQGGSARIDLDRDGMPAPLREFNALLRVSRGEAGRGSGPLPAWHWALGGADVALDSVQVSQHGRALPAVTGLSAQIGPYPAPSGMPIAADLRMRMAGGAWHFSGGVHPQPLGLDGALQVKDLDMSTADALMAPTFFGRFQRGALTISGQVQLGFSPGRAIWRYRGALATDKVELVDARSGDPVATWGRLRIPEFALGSTEGIQAPRIELDALHTAVLILPDHRTNWQHILRSPPDRTVMAPAASPASAWPVVLGQIVLGGASLDFQDQSLATPFRATLHDLDGTVGPVSNHPNDAWTDFELHGAVNHYGHASARGRFLLGAPLRLRAAAHFSDIELPTLNPYAAQIAGYRIDQGMLDLDLRYALEQGRIHGDNHALIHQLILGPQLPASPDRPDLPLSAILALLRNDEGVIDLDVPVSGDLNDPQATLRDIVAKAFQGALRETLDAPFDFIAQVLGRDPDELRHIRFAEDSARLDPAQLGKLQDLARELIRHPALRMFVQPGYAAQERSTGARKLAIRRGEAVKAALVSAGVRERRVYIDEPTALAAPSADGTVATVLDLKRP